MIDLLFADWRELGREIAPGIIPEKILHKDFEAVNKFLFQNPQYVIPALFFTCMRGDSEDIQSILEKNKIDLNFSSDSHLIFLIALHNNYLTNEENFFENSVSILKSKGLMVSEIDVKWAQEHDYLDNGTKRMFEIKKSIYHPL